MSDWDLSLKKKLGSETLASAIRMVLEDGNIREKAARLGILIRDEDGVANAVSAIEKVVAKGFETKSIP